MAGLVNVKSLEEFAAGDKYEEVNDDLTRVASDGKITSLAKAKNQNGAESLNKNEPSSQVASSTEPASADNLAPNQTPEQRSTGGLTKPTDTLQGPETKIQGRPSCLPCVGMKSVKLAKGDVEEQALKGTATAAKGPLKRVIPKLRVKPELYCGYLNDSTAKNADAAVANAYATVNHLCSGWMNASLSAKIMHCAKRANRNITTERPSQPTSAAILAWLDTVFAAVPVPSERAPSTPVPLPDDDPPRVCCFTGNWKSGGKRDVPAEPGPIDPAGPDRVVVGLADGVVLDPDDKGQVPPPSPSRRFCPVSPLASRRFWDEVRAGGGPSKC